MARKNAHTPEAIVAKLRQAEVLVGQGKTVAEAVGVMGGQVTVAGSSQWGRHVLVAIHREALLQSNQEARCSA